MVAPTWGKTLNHSTPHFLRLENKDNNLYNTRFLRELKKIIYAKKFFIIVNY